MKQQPQSNKWLCAVMTGLALAGSTSLSLAASDISQDFNSGAGSISDFSINFGTGALAWDSANGVELTGALKVTLSANSGAGKEVAPMWTIPAGPFDASDFFTLEYDLYINGTSGTDANGSYGNLQEVFSDSGWSWDSHWVGAVGSAYAGVWTHMSVPVPNNGKRYYRVLWALQGTAPYSGDVIAYIDNVVLKAQPNPFILDAFTEDTSGRYTEENWTGITATTALNTTEDAGGGQTPLGSLEINNEFTTGWQQSWIIRQFPAFVPSRWSYLECDVKVDPSSVPNAAGNYGAINFNVRDSSWADHQLSGPPVMDATWVGTWKHVKLPLPGTTSAGPTDIMLSGEHGGPLKVYIDNLMLTKPNTPPTIVGLQKGTSRGAYVTVDPGTDNQWDEEGISTPAADNSATDFFWIGQTPATYSITLADFPAPKEAPGFQGHIYLVNGDSLGTAFNYNTTYAGAPWNALDYVGFKIENTTDNSGVIATVEWKTNSPNANPPGTNVQRFNLTQYPTANGKWTFSFSDNTHGTIKGPDDAVAASFQLPDFSADANFMPASSVTHFGLSKNDGANSGVNNGKSATISAVQVKNIGVERTDNFDGGGLKSNYVWQVCTYWKNTQGRVFWRPGDTGWFVGYGNPSEGYSVQVSTNLSTWTSAGATYSYTDGTGIQHWAAVPSTNCPPGTGFFRLVK